MRGQATEREQRREGSGVGVREESALVVVCDIVGVVVGDGVRGVGVLLAGDWVDCWSVRGGGGGVRGLLDRDEEATTAARSGPRSKV